MIDLRFFLLERKKLRLEDIVTKLNGIAIDEDHPLSSLIGQYNVGERVTLAVFRDGKTLELTVTLEERK